MSGEQDRDTLAEVLAVAVDGLPERDRVFRLSNHWYADAILASDFLADLIRRERASALREAADKWRRFVADGRCPTCQMASRETVGMVCQTCGTDYAADRIEGER